MRKQCAAKGAERFRVAGRTGPSIRPATNWGLGNPELGTGDVSETLYI